MGERSLLLTHKEIWNLVSDWNKKHELNLSVTKERKLVDKIYNRMMRNIKKITLEEVE